MEGLINMSKKKEHKEEEQLNVKPEKAVDDSAVSPEPCSEKNNTTEDDGAETSPEESAAIIKEDLKKANDRYLRLMAEFDNYKKRTTREYQRMVESANEKLIGEMIHVRNTFELAIKHGETNTDYQKFFDGMKLIFVKFDQVLNTNGLSSFAEKGEPFDPLMHEALMKIPHEEIPDDHITDIYEKGYRLHDKIIKHAKVIVSSGKSAAVEDSAENGAK
jgi:molecular chaperone GrpE